MTERLDHDRLFKELLRVFFVEFLDLFFPEILQDIDKNSITFLDKEIFVDVTSGEKHEVDLVAKVKFLGKDAFFLVHLENQSEARGGFNRRMFRYFSRLLDLYELPIYPIAIFSYQEPKRPEIDNYKVDFQNFNVLSFHYRVIQLNRLNWRDYVNKPNPIASALMAKMDIKPTERAKVKLECLRLLVTLKLDRAKMQLISGFVDTYLKLNAEELKIFNQHIEEIIPQEKEQIMEIVTSWMEQGIQQGIQQGKTEEALLLVLRLLKKRFGAMDAGLETKLSQLALENIEELSESLLDFSSYEDLTNWLNLHNKEG
ncbi:MAG: DUF4351 domain-containing protein [Acidobacteria bacterium]|nr:DUF4351 domain-containing protein [Acidobacteriota bacterium]